MMAIYHAKTNVFFHGKKIMRRIFFIHVKNMKKKIFFVVVFKMLGSLPSVAFKMKKKLNF